MTVIAALFIGAVAGFVFSSICTASGVADDDEIRQQCFRDGYRQGLEAQAQAHRCHDLFERCDDPTRN